MVDLAEVQAVIKGILHLGPGYGVRFFAGVLSENVTVLAPLVTFIGDVPLKGEIFHRKLPPNMYVFEKSGVHLPSSGQTSAVWEMRPHRMSRGGAGESGRSLLVAGSAGAATGSGFGIGGAAGRRFLGGLVTGAASGAAA